MRALTANNHLFFVAHALVLALALAMPFAASAKKATADEPPESVRLLAANAQLNVEKSVRSAAGIQAWILTGGGNRVLAYEINGHAVVANGIFSSSGDNLLAQDQQEFLYDVAASYDALLTSGHLISHADAIPDVIGFYEPYCGFCSRAIQKLDSEGLHLTWAPVAFLHDRSPEVLAGILATEDPYSALVRSSRAIPEGRDAQWISEHPATDEAVEGASSAMSEHYALMGQAGLRGTPSFIAKVDGVPQVVNFEWVLEKFGHAR